VIILKIYVDSAKLNEIEESYSYGIADGVTTNPSLIKKAVDDLKKEGEKIDIAGYIKKILKVAEGDPVSLEVTELTYEGMVRQGKALFKKFNPVAKNVYIKVPVNPAFDKEPSMDGIKAIKELSRSKIPVNCTLIFTPEQALLAAKAGAKIVSPFAGRIDDYIRTQNNIPFEKTEYFSEEGVETKDGTLSDNGIVSGIDLVEQVVDIMRIYDLDTEVIAASIRTARQAREAALVGADIATLPFDTIKELLIHPKTQEGMKLFTQDIVPEYASLTKR
jgi:transaldolase